MKTLAVVSQKGGVGKTTLATCLAVAAISQGKRAAIIDMDPQATATFWKDTRKQDFPPCLSTHAARLSNTLKVLLEAQTELTIIDGAAVARDITYIACEYADFVLIPTKVATFDTMAMTQTLDLVQQIRPYAVVLTFVPPRGRETNQVVTLMNQLNATLCPVNITQRKAYYRAQEHGLAVQEYDPGSVPATEIQNLYNYINKNLGENHDRQ